GGRGSCPCRRCTAATGSRSCSRPRAPCPCRTGTTCAETASRRRQGAGDGLPPRGFSVSPSSPPCRQPTGAGLGRYEIAPQGSRPQTAATRAERRLQTRETPPDGVARLVDRAGLERAIGQLLLLRPVEQVQKGSDLRLRPR